MIEKNRTAKTKARSFEKVDNFAEKQKINNKTIAARTFLKIFTVGQGVVGP